MTRRPKLFTLAVAAVTAVAMIAPVSASQGGKSLIKSRMLNTGVEPSGRGLVEFVSNSAQSFFQIKVQHLTPDTAYDVSVDGQFEESFTTEPSGEGRVIHRTKTHGSPTPLPYDPRGGTIDISSQGTIVLTTDFPATSQQGQSRVEIRFSLTPGSGVAGKADTRFRSRGGRMKFDVEIENAVAGTYDVLVGGVVVSQIVVDTTGRGDVSFDTIPDSDPNDGDGIDVLMTFDPRGQAISIQLAAVDQFTGTFPLVP